MKSNAQTIKNIIETIPENQIFEANSVYKNSLNYISETTYYKTLERLCKQGQLVHLTKGIYYRPKKSRFGTIPITENEILTHYTSDGRGMIIGYRLFNQKGLTTQLSKNIDVLSTSLTEQKKNINNVCVHSSEVDLNDDTIPIIEVLEILQNYNNIEDINKSALAAYMRHFALNYSDTNTVFVLQNRKYKKSTIALLEKFLNYFDTSNSLRQFLSGLSHYSIPGMEEFYGTN